VFRVRVDRPACRNVPSWPEALCNYALCREDGWWYDASREELAWKWRAGTAGDAAWKEARLERAIRRLSNWAREVEGAGNWRQREVEDRPIALNWRGGVVGGNCTGQGLGGRGTQ
jgi:hypothetical protein